MNTKHLIGALFFVALFFVGADFAQTCTPPPAGMVAWFPGDGNANDIQNGNNGTINGAVTFAPGKVAQAFQFPGSGQVVVNDSPALDVINAVTLDAWINPVASSGFVLLAGKGNFGSAGGQPYSIFFNGVDRRIVFRVGNNSTFDALGGSTQLTFNAYTHVAATYDGTTMRIYINGNLDASQTTTIGTLANSDLPLLIGGSFNGAIDELEIFNRALAQSEIQAIVAANSAGKCKPPITFTVNTTSDTNDGACNQAHCSLREAIIAANANSVTSQPDRIHFNIPGSGVQTIVPTSALPTVTDPVVIDGYTQPGSAVNTATDGSTNAVLLIELNGQSVPTSNSIGLLLISGSDGSMIRGLVINSFVSDSGGQGIQVGASNVFVGGCFIGTNSTGTAALPNRTGVTIRNLSNPNTSGTRIGSAAPADRNLLSGNLFAGIEIASFQVSSVGITDTQLSGNLIGADAQGTAALPNERGVFFGERNGGLVTDTRIGVPGEGGGNVISGNRSVGVEFGVEAPNKLSGVSIRNNRIGTNAQGTAAVPNGSNPTDPSTPSRNGIYVAGVNNVQIGGTTAGEGNLISGNFSHGIALLLSSNNIIQGNLIGTNLEGTAAIPNGADGVSVRSSRNNTIGSTTSGAANLIANNVGDGVRVESTSTGNQILSNSIFANGGLGIDLIGGTPDANSVNLNDPGDSDTGGNNLQNYPVLSSAMSGASAATVQGTFNSMPDTQFRLEFFSNPACDASGFGEGQTFIGFQSITTDVSGNATVNFMSSGAVAAGQFITSTATDPNGNTSEFSACRQALAPTAAAVGVGGRVMTAQGNGISAVVSLTDKNGLTTTTITNDSGHYRFEEVEAGETYIISVKAKRYSFSQATQVKSINEEATDVNFIGYSDRRQVSL